MPPDVYDRLGDLAERVTTLASKKRARVLVTGGIPFSQWRIEATPDGFSSTEVTGQLPAVEAELADEEPEIATIPGGESDHAPDMGAS
jgi:hypothetical protein